MDDGISAVICEISGSPKEIFPQIEEDIHRA
jgi:hypothetical protein